jgi:tetratricopeptide (TPR) repeat protein
MRAFVFTDESLTRRAGQFVWLAVNTEESRNAAFVAKFPVSAWPSFFIVDPTTEVITYRWTGGATVAQLDGWLGEARRAPAAPSVFSAELEKADAANGRADYKDAATLYAQLLAGASRSFKDRPRVVDAYLFALQMTHQPGPCAEEAARSYPLERDLPNAASVAGSGLECALALPKGAKGRTELVSKLEAACRDVLANRTVRFATDDLSSVYQELISAREDARDAAGKKEDENAWVALLDDAATRAKTPEERTVFDPHRLAAYLEIGQPERAIPMLEQSERDFPQDYNPPARSAIAYRAMKEYGKALAAVDRALPLAYGPRKLTIYRTKASILEAQGKLEQAIATLRDAVSYGASLPKGQAYGMSGIKKDLARLEKPPENSNPGKLGHP